jgi:undecaprenyl-diphosphatase
MALWTIKPTRIDEMVANTVAENTTPALEELGRFISYAGDEHVLLAAAVTCWLYSELEQPRQRQLSRHMLVGALATKVLSHGIKRMVDQERPDRQEWLRHGNGIPKSGKAKDAFPSGHALHMGFLLSASSMFAGKWKAAARLTAAGVCVARIGVLAHWASDVAAGLVIGLAVERGLRRYTIDQLGAAPPDEEGRASERTRSL